LSDRWGRRKLCLTGTVLMGVFAFPTFWLVNTGSAPIGLLSLLLGCTIHAVMYGPQAALYAEMLPADVRYTGASVDSQLASVFARGMAPFIMPAPLAAPGAAWSVSPHILAMSVLTFVSVFTIR